MPNKRSKCLLSYLPIDRPVLFNSGALGIETKFTVDCDIINPDFFKTADDRTAEHNILHEGPRP
jgi:hypothetical protein